MKKSASWIKLEKAMSERILVLDGAMGSLIQEYKLEEEDFRGERWKNHPSSVKGNNDMLVISQPQIIKEIHARYFAAGADDCVFFSPMMMVSMLCRTISKLVSVPGRA